MDVYAEVARHALASRDDPAKAVLGNVSQSAGRADVNLDGRALTFCTSTELFDFEKEQHVQPEIGLAVHGFKCKKLDLAGLSKSQVRTLAGNGMATTSLVTVLLTVLIPLGYVQKSQTEG